MIDQPRQSPPGPVFLVFERRVAPLLLVMTIVFGVGLLPVAFLYWAGLTHEGATGDGGAVHAPARWQPATIPPMQTTIFSGVTAGFFEAEETFGTVRVGARADLLLVADNPLEEIRAVTKPLGVMLRGRWLDRAALDERLDALAAYAAAPTPNR